MTAYPPDPIHPDLKIPDYLQPLIKSYPVQRMRFIKQLGLKAYSGEFPSANHTRYEHSIGTMHLANKICGRIPEKTTDPDLRGSIKERTPLIVVAAFLHDIGHGPFSHVTDDVLRMRFKLTHEQMTTKIIKEVLKDQLSEINHSIDINELCDTILAKHKHPYINDIIAGEIDADRMDYLLRDAYHTGIQYRVDVNLLIDNMKLTQTSQKIIEEITKISGLDEEKRNELLNFIRSEISLVLRGTEGIVQAEMFLVTRKAMYENVYYNQNARCMERMVREAIHHMINDKMLRENEVKNPADFLKLDDFELFHRMQTSNKFTSEVVTRIKQGKPYPFVRVEPLMKFSQIEELFISNEVEKIANIEEDLAKEVKIDKERVLLDIIEVKPFRNNRVIVEVDDAQLKPLEEVSLIAKSLVEQVSPKLGIYVDDEEKGQKVYNKLTDK